MTMTVADEDAGGAGCACMLPVCRLTGPDALDPYPETSLRFARMFLEAASWQTMKLRIVDCGLAIADYQRDCLFNPKSAIHALRIMPTSSG